MTHNQDKTQRFLCCVLVFSRKEGDYAKFSQIRITKSSGFRDWSYCKLGLKPKLTVATDYVTQNYFQSVFSFCVVDLPYGSAEHSASFDE